MLLSAFPAAAHAPTIDVVEIEGVIDGVVGDYVVDTLAEAHRDGSELFVIQLDTPGGLGDATERVLDAVAASRVPVVVWVGPPGSRAFSAGMFIGYAAHVLALSPGSAIGAPAPLDLAAGEPDRDSRAAAAARLEALARQRGHDPEFARTAALDDAVAIPSLRGAPVEEVRARADVPEQVQPEDLLVLSADDAVERGVVDVVAPTLADTLAEIDGREVTIATPDGGTFTRRLNVDGAHANVRFHQMGLLGRMLHTVTNPTLAYLLIMTGALAMLFELFQPGFGVAGVSGAVLFALGAYGLIVLPVSWLAFALLAVGLVLLAVDLAVAGLGALTAAGAVALAVGSFLLFDAPPPLRLSPWLIAVVVLASLVFFVVVMTTVLRAQAGPAVADAEELVGKLGVVRSMLNPEGHVFVDGALWRARAPDTGPGTGGKVRTGTAVRVVGVRDGLTLEVEIVEGDVEPSAARTPAARAQ